MENTRQIKLEPGMTSRSTIAIDKLHNCADCPIRKLAMKQPQSIFAKLHSWHKTWWPGWKAHQVRACAFATGMDTND
jgi:hypothetical protein